MDKRELWLMLDEDYDMLEGSQSRRSRSGKKNKKPAEIRAGLADELHPVEHEIEFTYKASRHERQWLLSALGAFYSDSLIEDVLSLVKGGKEANVYCCRANETLGYELLAAKVYRPRLLRNLKNDALYKEGRPVLADDGKHVRDQRSQRAIRKKTRIGAEMAITSWIEHEFQALSFLHQAGASVPEPIAQRGNAILMEYFGEVGLAAPTLNTVRLSPDEGRELFDRLLANVELMLAYNRVHADLSAYNILYWQNQVKIIDFPQVIDPLYNPKGYVLLARDLERLCQYFTTIGLALNPTRLANDLWGRYRRGELARGYSSTKPADRSWTGG
jgi:RIO kinase 1